MPEDAWDWSEPNETPRIRAWTAHYIAKGCNSTKAEWVARRKVRNSNTWPPK